MSTAVGVMARAPSSGGKSRLAPHLSSSRLAALRAALLADTLLAVERLPDLTIFFTPDDAEHEVAALAPSAIRREPQGGGDLGARMLRALRFLLPVPPVLPPVSDTVRALQFLPPVSDTVAAERQCLTPHGAILIGSDVPLLSADHILEAGETLRVSGGVVLGPADDGGYYLIGMTEAHPSLFDGIAWGTESVLTDTLRAAERRGVEARLARSAYDIDTIDDLRRLARDLAAAPAGVCPAVRRWLSEA